MGIKVQNAPIWAFSLSLIANYDILGLFRDKKKKKPHENEDPTFDAPEDPNNVIKINNFTKQLFQKILQESKPDLARSVLSYVFSETTHENENFRKFQNFENEIVSKILKVNRHSFGELLSKVTTTTEYADLISNFNYDQLSVDSD